MWNTAELLKNVATSIEMQTVDDACKLIDWCIYVHLDISLSQQQMAQQDRIDFYIMRNLTLIENTEWKRKLPALIARNEE